MPGDDLAHTIFWTLCAFALGVACLSPLLNWSI
jgi:hypothetical protein